MKFYILSDAQHCVITKQDGYSSEVRAPRLYKTATQAARFAAKFKAAVFTVTAPELVGNGYQTYDAVKRDAQALGLSCIRFCY